MIIIKTLKLIGREFYKLIYKSKIKRIMTVALAIVIVWIGAEITLGLKIEFNLKHDLIALGLAIVIEQCLPWGGRRNKNIGDGLLVDE